MKKAILTAGVITALTPVLNSDMVFANNVDELSVQNEYARNTVENMNATGKVNVNSSTVLNIRSQPNTNSSVKGKMKSGSVVKITGKASNGWYKIEYKGIVGYASNKYITLTTNQSQTSSAQVSSRGKVNTTTANLNVRKSPTTKASITGKLSPGTVVDVLEKESNGWYYISNNGKKGYVDGAYITLVNSSSSNTTSQNTSNTSNVGKIATVNTNVLNLRSGAGTNYSIVNKLYSGNTVKILSSNSNGWYKVELASGVTGWCDGRYLNNFRNGSLSSSNSNSSNTQTQNQKVQAVINLAKSKLGCKYVWGAEGPNTFDCSGLTMYVYKNGAGVSIPRTSRDQAKAGRYVAKSDLQPGDLVFFDSNYGNTVNHVGLYIGNNQMIHSPKPGDVVKIQNIDINHYKKAYITARRFL